ncbi:hypothetical protein FHY52_04450 [Nocardia nova]|uniref:hypothetical protein n=1 Tax=Nocardia nova TaxID=37330 RepID=UPI0025AEDD7D|nr:hypothetical protein [Nocardia nova]MDN2495949.1 hypothetical protein [Nocardia nova]
MLNVTVKALLLVVAVLLAIIVGMTAAWLAIAREAHFAIAVRDGGVGFGGTLTLGVLLLSHLEAL